MGMCHAQIKLSTLKKGYQLGPMSDHCSRTLHGYIRFFIMIITAYTNKQRTIFTFRPARAL